VTVPRPGARQYVARLVADAVARSHPICLDSAIVIAHISRAQPVDSLIAPVIRDPSVRIVLSTVTLAEAVGRPASHGDHVRVQAIRRALLALPGTTIVDLDQDHAVETAWVRAMTGLKLPDAAIVATARRAGAGALLGNDRQWRGKPLGVPYHHMDDILALP
jgi:PIN domain nuclease of toxin-antitoxin system